MATKVMLWAYTAKTLQKIPSSRCSSVYLRTYNRSGARIETIRGASSWFVSDKGIEESPEEPVTPADEDHELEDESAIETLRDVSRLPTKMRCYMESSLKVPERIHDHEFSKKYELRLLAHYGRASGVDPSIAWPDKYELDEMKEFDRDWEPTLQQSWELMRTQKEEEMETLRIHEANVAKAMARMPEYIEQFKKRLDKQDKDVQKQEGKQKALMEEARDYFGYNIDPRDPRLKEMQERKAEEEQLKKRKQRKEEKSMRLEAALDRLKGDGEALKKAEKVS